MGLRVKFIGPVNFRETQLESKRIQKDIHENLRIEKENQRIQDSVLSFSDAHVSPLDEYFKHISDCEDSDFEVQTRFDASTSNNTHRCQSLAKWQSGMVFQKLPKESYNIMHIWHILKISF